MARSTVAASAIWAAAFEIAIATPALALSPPTTPAVWTPRAILVDLENLPGSHDVREETGPVAVAWVNVDDGGARIDSCEPDQLGQLGLVVHRDLRYGWALDELAAREGRSKADRPPRPDGCRWPALRQPGVHEEDQSGCVSSGFFR